MDDKKEDVPNETKLRKKPNKGPYILGEALGEGAFAKVRLATQIHIKEKCAIKIVDKRLLEDIKDVQRLKKEIKILKSIRHKNIVQLYDIMESETNLYFVLEYCKGGELFDYIVKNKRLTENEACIFFQQIINGVEYLHEQGIIHRDLKPENLLLDYNNNIKISDFGLSTFFSKNNFLQTACGTPSYAPPEMLEGQQYNGEASDIWSCGIILYAMLCGTLPFTESKEEIIIRKIKEHDYKIPKYLSKEAQDILYHILKINPEERFSIENIKSHPWFNIVKPHLMKGITFDEIKIPIDENILDMVKECGFDKDECRNLLIKNKFCSLTTIYYLCLKKFNRGGGKSISDLESELFENYINNPANYIKQKNFEDKKGKEENKNDRNDDDRIKKKMDSKEAVIRNNPRNKNNHINKKKINLNDKNISLKNQQFSKNQKKNININSKKINIQDIKQTNKKINNILIQDKSPKVEKAKEKEKKFQISVKTTKLYSPSIKKSSKDQINSLFARKKMLNEIKHNLNINNSPKSLIDRKSTIKPNQNNNKSLEHVLQNTKQEEDNKLDDVNSTTLTQQKINLMIEQSKAKEAYQRYKNILREGKSDARNKSSPFPLEKYDIENVESELEGQKPINVINYIAKKLVSSSFCGSFKFPSIRKIPSERNVPITNPLITNGNYYMNNESYPIKEEIEYLTGSTNSENGNIESNEQKINDINFKNLVSILNQKFKKYLPKSSKEVNIMVKRGKGKESNILKNKPNNLMEKNKRNYKKIKSQSNRIKDKKIFMNKNIEKSQNSNEKYDYNIKEMTSHYNKFLDISTNYDAGLDSREGSSYDRANSSSKDRLKNFSFSLDKYKESNLYNTEKNIQKLSENSQKIWKKMVQNEENGKNRNKAFRINNKYGNFFEKKISINLSNTFNNLKQ